MTWRVGDFFRFRGIDYRVTHVDGDRISGENGNCSVGVNISSVTRVDRIEKSPYEDPNERDYVPGEA